MNADTGERLAAAWQNLTPQLASIDGPTLVARQHGVIRVVAMYGLASAELQIQAIANFVGGYPSVAAFGPVYEVGCFYYDSPTRPCTSAGRAPVGNIRIVLLAQTRDRVTGYMQTDAGVGDVTGTVNEVGVLTLNGTLNLKGPSGRLDSWATTTSPIDNSMSGTFNFVFPASGDPQSAIRYELRQLPRTPPAQRATTTP